jgi:membrane protease YdiL (CAAX protease family)
VSSPAQQHLWRAAPVAVLVGAMAALAVAPRGTAAQWVVLVVVAPLLEEVVFRAGLHEWLLRRSTKFRTANLLTALVFGGAHVLLRADPLAWATALPALLIGRVYEQTRRVRWCVALHAAMNGSWLLVHPWL